MQIRSKNKMQGIFSSIGCYHFSITFPHISTHPHQERNKLIKLVGKVSFIKDRVVTFGHDSSSSESHIIVTSYEAYFSESHIIVTSYEAYSSQSGVSKAMHQVAMVYLLAIN